MSTKTALIIGAGPAGLTAAFELLKRTDIHPVVYEASDAIGGISQTINYKGNRMDIGGHRFFSKSDRVMAWWQDILPLQGADDDEEEQTIDIAYQRKHRSITLPKNGPHPDATDNVMLVRARLSRIYSFKKFFDYPVALNATTIRNLGPVRMAKIGVSYTLARVRPIKPERTLEEFMINRFGRELYLTFFKDYTEKVWGVPCNEIDSEWGAQRIKGLSLTKAVLHALKQPFQRRSSISQKDTETSLIEQFMYPKLGPGQMWEEVARRVELEGGEVHMRQKVVALAHDGATVTGATVVDEETGHARQVAADYVFSTMPVKELIAGLGCSVPPDVKAVADGLLYRDFITVGVLMRRLALPGGVGDTNIVPDNWIYIQERDVKLGRLQVFNNWSPYLVADPNTVWLGLEYFCNEGDELWTKSDNEFFRFAVDELARIHIIDKNDVLDGTVVRVKKTYPAYFGTYNHFDKIRDYTDRFENLYLLGRNGMHRYNNADHSMLTAMTAVDNIVNGERDKENVWSVNTESEYHEEK
ncbi:MAG: NAD(P)/FAD-dependent oxidoreductase [Chloroflexia bacterium]|nr:NAD(P)/FAD-dependent oxidoreductase [Chloroflexia bacterium]